MRQANREGPESQAIKPRVETRVRTTGVGALAAGEFVTVNIVATRLW